MFGTVQVQELKQLLQILSSQPDDEEEAEGGVAGGQMTEDMVRAQFSGWKAASVA